ncbi:MAG: hypothetical protein AAGC63_17080, partial [Propionicimonas sp.]|nr:hypothetical protein [Propionicimonas sp.]
MGRTSGDGRRQLRTCAAALALGLVALIGLPAPDAAADPAGAWQPVDAGTDWGQPTVSPVGADEVPGCTGDRSAWRAGDEVVTLIVLECPDAATAAGVVSGIGLSADLSGAPEVPPTFGEGVDLALRTADGNLDRYWSQCTTYLGVGTSCGARDCGSATARYAHELAGRFPGTPNPIWPTPATGPVTGFVPSGGPWALVADATLPSAQLRVVDCALARERQWRASGRVLAMVSVVDCGSPELAFRAWSSLWGALTSRPAESGVLGPDIDGAGSWQVDDQRTGYGRAWVQGTAYAYVHRICPHDDLDACRQATADDAVQLARLLPGEPVPDSRGWTLAVNAALWLFVVPLGTLLLLVLARSLWRRSRETGWAVAPTPPGFTVVDGEVRRARRGRWLRGATATLLVMVAYVAGVVWTTGTGNPLAFGLWVFGSPLLLVPAVLALLGRVWPASRVVRVARGPRGRRGAAA